MPRLLRLWFSLREGVGPRAYWRLWSDGFVEAIHRRVLEGIARQAEAERTG